MKQITELTQGITIGMIGALTLLLIINFIQSSFISQLFWISVTLILVGVFSTILALVRIK